MVDKKDTKKRKKTSSSDAKAATEVPKKKNFGEEVFQENEKVEEFVQEEINSSDCCHVHDHKCKFGFAFVAIILVAICAISEYFFDHERYSELSKKSTSTMNSVQEGRELIENFGKKMEAIDKRLSSLENKTKAASINDGRKKWKVWVALKNKLELGENFKDELKLFNEIFTYDTELLQLVKETVSDIEIEPKGSDGAVMETVKRYVNKVVTVRKIDHKKLLEISGYVITSLEGGLINE